MTSKRRSSSALVPIITEVPILSIPTTSINKSFATTRRPTDLIRKAAGAMFLYNIIRYSVSVLSKNAKTFRFSRKKFVKYLRE